MYMCGFLLFTVPKPIVRITSIDTVEYGKTITLECNAIAARGITSRVDIIWQTGHNYTTVKRVDNVMANITNGSAIYTDHLVIPPFRAKDNGVIYYCVVNINATFGLNGFAGFTVEVIGK